MSTDREVIVITGSGGGFGLALARVLLQAGFEVMLSARRQSSVEHALAQLATFGSQVQGIRCDVAVAEDLESLARMSWERCGRLDVWINNAASAGPAAALADLPLDAAREIVATNILGTLYGTRAALAYMLPAGRGTIVNIYGRGDQLQATPITGAYAASKAWVRSFTRTLHSELRHSGVNVLGFNPGLMRTDMTLQTRTIGDQAVRAMRVFPTVVRVLADPPEIPARRLARRLSQRSRRSGELRLPGLLSLLGKLPRLLKAHKSASTPRASG
jgi:NAD(P)-dependent dehydrogenase (short-subunit alcohol dehydrogenase family)